MAPVPLPLLVPVRVPKPPIERAGAAGDSVPFLHVQATSSELVSASARVRSPRRRRPQTTVAILASAAIAIAIAATSTSALGLTTNQATNLGTAAARRAARALAITTTICSGTARCVV